MEYKRNSFGEETDVSDFVEDAAYLFGSEAGSRPRDAYGSNSKASKGTSDCTGSKTSKNCGGSTGSRGSRGVVVTDLSSLAIGNLE